MTRSDISGLNLSIYGPDVGSFSHFSKNTHQSVQFLWRWNFENMGVARGRATKNVKIWLFTIFKCLYRALGTFFWIFAMLQLITMEMTKEIQILKFLKKWAWPNNDASIMQKYEKCHFSMSHKARLPIFNPKKQYKY